MKRILIVMAILVVLTLGCKTANRYRATFSTISSFDYIENGEEYSIVLHEGDTLYFTDLVEEGGKWYALFPYKDTKRAKVLLGKRISENVYEYAKVEHK